MVKFIFYYRKKQNLKSVDKIADMSNRNPMQAGEDKLYFCENCTKKCRFFQGEIRDCGSKIAIFF